MEKQSLKGMWDTVSKFSIVVTRVLEKERENEAETIFEDVIVNNFTKLKKDIKRQLKKINSK